MRKNKVIRVGSVKYYFVPQNPTSTSSIDLGTQDITYSENETDVFITPKIKEVEYYTSTPSSTPTTNYIVNDLSKIKDNGYFLVNTTTPVSLSDLRQVFRSTNHQYKNMY